MNTKKMQNTRSPEALNRVNTVGRTRKHGSGDMPTQSVISQDAFFADAKVDPISGLYEAGQTTPLGSHTVAEPTRTERAKASLKRLDNAEVTSQDKRRRGLGVMTGAIAVGILAVTPVGDVIKDSGDRILATFDSHNLPPGGEPLEYRGGESFEPGTDNTIVVPPIELEP